ncbi:hypothetical protein [Marinactinospora rubrisoli]|uniref:Secreted protein n=1 Tax=Marinactinospora rubrisoli TaxID=2715399 RepID=A0ABW2KFS7_9ACTN
MFSFARSSAKAVLVTVSAAGFVAFGSGIASADVLGDVTRTLNTTVPATGAVNQVTDQLRGAVPANGDIPELATTLPAPVASNVGTPVGDVTEPVTVVGSGLTAAEKKIDEVVRGLKGRAPEAPGAGDVTTLPQPVDAPGTETLPSTGDVRTGVEDVRSQVEGQLPETSLQVGPVDVPADLVTGLVEDTVSGATGTVGETVDPASVVSQAGAVEGTVGETAESVDLGQALSGAPAL